MLDNLVLEIQASACRLSCRHCYASDFKVRKAQTDLEDIRRCIDYFQKIVRAKPLVYIYKDILDFDPLEVLLAILVECDLLASIAPLPTHGWPKDGDTAKAVRSLSAAGVSHVWLTLHGSRDTHDAFVRRHGAHAQLRDFARCAADAGISVQWNLMLRHSNAMELLAQLVEVSALRDACDIFVSVPAAVRAATKLDRDRPTIDQLQLLRSAGARDSTDLLSESQWRERLAMGLLSTKRQLGSYAEIRVMPDRSILLHDLLADLPIGRWDQDEPAAVLQRAQVAGSVVGDLLGPQPTPAILALARRTTRWNALPPREHEVHCIYSMAATWLRRLQYLG
ncbi:radical SAM protein [Variovorax sp. ZT5P49]|uniref:radical SAM protein n=1 Tax=Variovorax sp. ZT5P49 TaxID=3443733 RepID=UPI003F47267B